MPYKLWPTLFAASASFLAGQAAAESKDATLPKSRPLLEQRVQELKDESRQKTIYVSDLKKLAEDVGRAQQCLDAKTPPDDATLRPARVALDASWKTVLAAPAANILDQGNKEYDALRSAASSLVRLVPTGRDCIGLLPTRSFNVRPDGARIPSASTQITDFVTRTLSASARPAREAYIPELESFLTEFVQEGRKRSALRDATISAITAEIASLANVSSIIRQNLQSQRESIKPLLPAIQGEIRSAETRLEEIDKSLSELDERLSSGAASLDRQLILAVYMMIGSLLVLFLGVRFLPQAIAAKVIETRSLVEVVSMAFLLLTIIILGTGEKMPKEAIGTLLGSIAGYIFGRKMYDGK